MSEPIPPPPQEPFQPTAKPRGGGGCGRMALLGCGVLVVLVGLGMVVFVLKLPALMGWAFGRMHDEVVAHLPADVTAEERARLDRAFTDAVDAASHGRVDPAVVQKVQPLLMEVAAKPPDRLTRQDILDLTRALEEMAGKKPPPAPASPPAPAPARPREGEQHGASTG